MNEVLPIAIVAAIGIAVVTAFVTAAPLAALALVNVCVAVPLAALSLRTSTA